MLVEDLGVTFDQYADDTQLYIALSPGLDSLAILKNCADTVNYAWFLTNYLMLNTNKTEATCSEPVLFGLRTLSLQECVPFSDTNPIAFD